MPPPATRSYTDDMVRTEARSTPNVHSTVFFKEKADLLMHFTYGPMMGPFHIYGSVLKSAGSQARAG